jgi:histidyl-tRNA synthetase
VFEFTTTDLGAQSTVLAGGRYDRLMKNMGGNDTPSVGFAAGVDRLMLLINEKITESRPVALVNISEKELDYCLKLQNMLKNNGINIEFISNGKMKQKLDVANKLNCKYVVIIGESEVMSGEFTLKDLDSREEKKLKENDITRILKEV